MLDPWREHSSLFEPMFLTPFCRHVGKGDNEPCVRKLHEELNNAIVFYMLFFLFFVPCMIFCESMCLLKLLY